MRKYCRSRECCRSNVDLRTSGFDRAENEQSKIWQQCHFATFGKCCGSTASWAVCRAGCRRAIWWVIQGLSDPALCDRAAAAGVGQAPRPAGSAGPGAWPAGLSALAREAIASRFWPGFSARSTPTGAENRRICSVFFEVYGAVRRSPAGPAPPYPFLRILKRILYHA